MMPPLGVQASRCEEMGETGYEVPAAVFLVAAEHNGSFRRLFQAARQSAAKIKAGIPASSEGS